MADEVLTTTLRITADTTQLRSVTSALRDVQAAGMGAAQAVAGASGQRVIFGPRGEILSVVNPAPLSPTPSAPSSPGQPHGPKGLTDFLFSRRGAGVAALGYAGIMGQQALSRISGAIGEYYGAESGLQGGLASGSLPTAMNSVLQAQATRAMAKNTALIGGSTGIMGAGSMAYGGAIAAAHPLGAAGLVIGGALLSFAGQWGTSAANSMVATLSAKGQAAVGFGERALGAGLGMAEETMKLGGLGRRGLGMGDYRMGARYGFGAQRFLSMYGQFAGSGGIDFDPEMMAASARSGVSPDQAGRFQRSFAPGMGASTSGGLWTALDKTVSNAVNSGVSRARIPEYLSHIQSLNERLADRGLTVNFDNYERERVGMMNSGLKGFQANTAQAGFQSFGENLLQSMWSEMVPPDMVQSVVKMGLFNKFGDWKGAAGGLESMLGTGSFGSFAGGLAGGFPDLLGTGMLSQMSGLLPGAAGRLKGFIPSDVLSNMPESGGLFSDLWGGFKSVAGGLMGTGEGGLLKQKAVNDSVEVLSVSLGKLQVMLDKTTELLGVSYKNFSDQYSAAMGKLNDELRSVPTDPTGAALGWGPPR